MDAKGKKELSAHILSNYRLYDIHLIEMVYDYVFDGSDMNMACYVGKLEDVKKILTSRCPTFSNHITHDMMYSACMGGHMNVIQYFIDNGCTDYDSGLEGACHGGHISIINLMISLGATDYNMGAYGASQGENKVIAVMMILAGANPYWAWSGCFGAVRYSQHMIDYMKEIYTHIP